MKRQLNLMREFSVPLLAGAAAAMVWANLDFASYGRFKHAPLLGSLSFDFLTNEIFMVFFFGIAAVEIVQACLPGGTLNPPRKALNPLMATLGGVAGPALLYLAAAHLWGQADLIRGWGIPTATDIALAWLTARLIFGAGHPVIAFLLLLAIADDAIGLVIIAVFYPDPAHPVALPWLGISLLGMATAFALRRFRARNYWPYLLLGGGASWAGLFLAHLHPALALVFIVPFMPHGRVKTKEFFEEEPEDRSTLTTFEHEWKVIVDFGLFLFGLSNAGVPLAGVGPATWIVLGALIVGKTLGVTAFGWIAVRMGLPLPEGMDLGHLAAAGLIAGIGFTVAIFVAGAAFTDPVLEGAAKMGAMLSIAAGPLAWGLARLLKLSRHQGA